MLIKFLTSRHSEEPAGRHGFASLRMTIAKRPASGLMILGAVFIFCFAGDGFSAEDKKIDKKTAVAGTEAASKPAALENKTPSPGLNHNETIDEQKLIQLSKSLKNAIDENKELKKDRERVLSEIKQLRGAQEIDSNRLSASLKEIERLKQAAENKLEQARKASEDQTRKDREHEQEIKDLRAAANQKTKELEMKLKETGDNLAEQKKWRQEIEGLMAPPPDEGGLANGRTSGQKQSPSKMLSKIQQLTQENDQLKSDSAKVHYNLGNIFFKQGDYKRSADEYAQALKLMPYDAANHYNLAFVSGEFLNDQKAALKHYQQYLFLNPNAKDAAFVKEKILKALMELKSTVDSSLDAKTKINDDF